MQAKSPEYQFIKFSSLKTNIQNEVSLKTHTFQDNWYMGLPELSL